MANLLRIIGVESGGINLKAEVIKALGSRLKDPPFFLDQTDFSADHWIMKRNTHHQRVVLFGRCDRGHDRNSNSRFDESEHCGDMLRFKHALGQLLTARDGLIQNEAIARVFAHGNIGIARQLRPSNFLSLGQRMITPAGHHELFFEQGREFKIGLLNSDEVQAKISRALGDKPQDTLCVVIKNSYPDIRMFLWNARIILVKK